MPESVISRLKFIVILSISLMLLPVATNAGHRGFSALFEDLEDILVEAEAANALLDNVALTDNGICEKLTQAHDNIHKLHSTVEELMEEVKEKVSIEDQAFKVLEQLSAVFVVMATRNSDLSINSTAIKCSEAIHSYAEGMDSILSYSDTMSSILSMAHDIGALAHHMVEIADRIIVTNDVEDEVRKMAVKSLSLQNDNLKLTQSLNLVAQRNSLRSVNYLNNSPYSELYEQLFTGGALSNHAANAFLTNFNLAREWEHLVKGMDGLVSQVKLTHDKIRISTTSQVMTVDKASYVAMVEMSNMIRLITNAVEKMSETTEHLSFTTNDAVLRDSVGSMMEISTQILFMVDQVKDMSDIILQNGNKAGLTSDQLIAAKELQGINYQTTLATVESIQAKATSIVKVNSL